MDNYIRNQILAKRLKESQKSPTGSPDATISATLSMGSAGSPGKRKVEKDIKFGETKAQILRLQANIEKMQLMEKKQQIDNKL